MSLKCVSSCGAGFFVGKGKKCERCALKCKTCNGTASSCKSCDFPYFYTASDCVTKCPPGFYGNVKQRLCKPCDKICQTCSDGETGDMCRSCPVGSFLSKYFTNKTLIQVTDLLCSVSFVILFFLSFRHAPINQCHNL